MDSYFRVLGVRRGSSEEDIRRAYKSKALQYHPDRNPGGGETFKHINEAYEVLRKHYKVNNGQDRQPYDYKSSSNYCHTGAMPRTTTRSAWDKCNSPLFTEEELFGSLGLNKPTSGVHSYTGTRRGFRQRDQYQHRHNTEPTVNADGPPASRDAYKYSDAALRKSHGNRKPASAYNLFKTTNEMDSFMKQMQRFDEAEVQKKTDFFFAGEDGKVSSNDSPSGEANGHQTWKPEFGRRSDMSVDTESDLSARKRHGTCHHKHHSNGEGNSESNGNNSNVDIEGSSDSNLASVKARFFSKKHSSSLPPDRKAAKGDSLKRRSASSVGVEINNLQTVSSAYDADGAKCNGANNNDGNNNNNDNNDSKGASWRRKHPSMVDKYRSINVIMQKEMDEEWAFERLSQQAISRAEEAMRATESRLRKEKLAQEALEEWNNTQRQMEMENTAREIEERIKHLNRKSSNNDIVTNPCNHDTFMDCELRKLAIARRQVRCDSMRQILPNVSEISKLPLSDIYILQGLFKDMSDQVFTLLENRIMTTSICIVCKSSKIDSKSNDKHECKHGMMCSFCAGTSVCCPLCGGV